MNKRLIAAFAAASLLTAATGAIAAGNEVNPDFRLSKKELLTIYKEFFTIYKELPTTLYCQARFDPKTKEVFLPEGFTTPAHVERAKRVEWEHVVPAENFGRSFKEWQEGAPVCKDKKGRSYKGRKCAETASREYALMQADMYNLFPAIGAVNAVRLNYRYALLPDAAPTFGSCPMKITNRRAEPPVASRGEISRAMLYMAETYPTHYRLSDRDRRMVEAWNEAYPVDPWECIRAARIESAQGNANRFVKDVCIRNGMRYPLVEGQGFIHNPKRVRKARQAN